LYDRVDLIPFAKLTTFFTHHLNNDKRQEFVNGNSAVSAAGN
jgi:hypothetical protein